MSYSDPLIAAARNLTYFNGLRHESYQLKTALVFGIFPPTHAYGFFEGGWLFFKAVAGDIHWSALFLVWGLIGLGTGILLVMVGPSKESKTADKHSNANAPKENP